MSNQSIEAGADTVAYLVVGSGHALVIIHGVGGHKEDWESVSAALSTDRTVYSIDMLGFGESSRDARDLSMDAQAKAVLTLLDRKGIPSADIIGNSVGGWVAATFAAQYPERVGKLVLVDAAGFDAMFQGDPPVNLFPNNADEMAQLLSFVLASDFAHTPEFAQQAFEKFQASGEKAIEPVLGPGLFRSARLEAVMPKIKAETLVIWGKEDKLFPVNLAGYIAGLTPGARVVTIDHASHFPHIDQPEALIAAVQSFLLAQ